MSKLDFIKNLLNKDIFSGKPAKKRKPCSGFLGFALIMALASVVAITILTILGGQINTTVNKINNVLSGVNANVNTTGGYSSPTVVYNPPDSSSNNTTPPSIPVVFNESEISDNNTGGDRYQNFDESLVKLTAKAPISTFSLDVDTASYSNIRSYINNGQIPPKDAVRLEELINYFNYNYSIPQDKSRPFKPTVNVFQTPWNKDTKLLHVGIKGYDISIHKRPRLNLTFLVDVSGSMGEPNKLPLVIDSLKLLVKDLQNEDTISIVTYAGSSGIALNPTKGWDKWKIIKTLENLQASGSTAGCDGIITAYELAQKNYIKNGVNRVILATDGDFNVGTVDPEALQKLIEKKRKTGIYLSILGYGMGNYNDLLMQKLAQNGNGIAAYIDNLDEAGKVLIEDMRKNMFPIANDVKVQVEFNPARVAKYRLIGYETRALKTEDFKNDKVDAGDIGAGHSVTAIYEITETGSNARLLDDSHYLSSAKPIKKGSNEYAFLKMRYKLPKHNKSILITYPITSKNETQNIQSLEKDIIFSVAVAGFGHLIKQSQFIKNFTYDDVITLATFAKGKDKFNHRKDFIELVKKAKDLDRKNIVSLDRD